VSIGAAWPRWWDQGEQWCRVAAVSIGSAWPRWLGSGCPHPSSALLHVSVLQCACACILIPELTPHLLVSSQSTPLPSTNPYHTTRLLRRSNRGGTRARVAFSWDTEDKVKHNWVHVVGRDAEAGSPIALEGHKVNDKDSRAVSRSHLHFIPAFDKNAMFVECTGSVSGALVRRKVGAQRGAAAAGDGHTHGVFEIELAPRTQAGCSKLRLCEGDCVTVPMDPDKTGFTIEGIPQRSNSTPQCPWELASTVPSPFS
jgi:hypothetical protein